MDPNLGQDNNEDDGDLHFDCDSALGTDVFPMSTRSMTQSILEYRCIHGRTYHSLRGNAEYWSPNDQIQNDAMDATHHVFMLMLNHKLFLAPIPDNVKTVLDIGTGTGIWAIDFADEYPAAEVTGTDLSPIQPVWVPPNLRFQIDDFTTPWTWAVNSIDFVHSRCLFGSVPDWPLFFAESFRVLRPGGWAESFEQSCFVRCDDGSIPPPPRTHPDASASTKETLLPIDELLKADSETILAQWGPIFSLSGQKTGRSFTIADEGLVSKWMREAGFVDVREETFKIPMTGWSKDERLREMGHWNHAAVHDGMEGGNLPLVWVLTGVVESTVYLADMVGDKKLTGYVLYLATSVLGWTKEQCDIFMAKMRKAIDERRFHGYYTVSVVYGRKPEAPS